ncbi:hypothetical protein [Botrimarina hoheduenensis]|uniref:Uncharacterized protein n=1 Tax=Botrimarina hoheduenensis TaxID=2528000 RepID=A0A5C5W7V1_9BACT|nr:hypothetical protein [Botrimarina hoheduenensis]TWT46654.1 hypothetical protein Pla111_17550 [Botrimarina hoheduenensis]
MNPLARLLGTIFKASSAAILVGLLTLLPSAIATGMVSVESRLVALEEQIELRYRNQPAAAARLRTEARAMVAAWQAEPDPSAGDYRRMHRWFDIAFRATLPGGSGELPGAPRLLGRTALQQPRGVIEPLVEPMAAIPAAALESSDPLMPQSLLPQQSSSDHAAHSVLTLTPPTLAAGEVSSEAGDAYAHLSNPSAPRGQLAPASEFAEPRRVEKPITAADRPATSEPTLVGPHSPGRSHWSQHASAAPLDWRDPFTDDPTASVNPLRRGLKQQVQRPIVGTPSGISVNLTELTARVRGYNTALRELQQRLLADPAPDAFVLSDWATELEQLALEESFLDLYREGLGEAERRALPPSPSIELVSELLRRRADDQLSSRDFEGAKRRALESVSARMSRIEPARDAF